MVESGFYLFAPDGRRVRFRYYLDHAPHTCEAFAKLLPFSRVFLHARYSGCEIWTDSLPPVRVIQENASIWVHPGEVVLGPELAVRTSTINCLGIYYGEGKGVDACNIFAVVLEEDQDALAELGELIWKSGQLELTFDQLRTSMNG